MTIPLDIFEQSIYIFMLIFIRITGLFVIAPIFGRRNLPNIYKVAFSFFVAIIASNVVDVAQLPQPVHILEFILVVSKEFIVGISIGFIAYLILMGIYLAGQMIDMRIGFGMVNVMDPLANIQIPVSANFYFITTMLIFLMIDGHHMLIYAVVDSFSILPLGKAIFHQGLIDNLIRIFTNVFFIGFKIAAPITAAILITDVALGVVSKAVPQMNVFMLGMPLKIIIGLLVMVITIVSFRAIVNVLMEGMYNETYNFVEQLNTGG